MPTGRYELRFTGLGGFDAPELQQAIGPEAYIIRDRAPSAAHGDLALLAIGVMLGARTLTAAFLYFSRKSTTSQLTMSVQVLKPGGTVTTILLKLDTHAQDALSDQAIAQLAAALKITPSELLEAA